MLEWHGNLYLETESDTFTTARTINMGFLLGNEMNDSYGWDGIECTVNYDPSATETAVFAGRDVYHQVISPPDYVDGLSETLASEYIDVSNDWMIMAEKSFIECDSPNTGTCKINMHFMRMQATNDMMQDHQIDTSAYVTTFKGRTWYTVQTPADAANNVFGEDS